MSRAGLALLSTSLAATSVLAAVTESHEDPSRYSWPNGVVPYKVERDTFRSGLFRRSHYQSERHKITDAIKYWEDLSCVRFEECETIEDCRNRGGYLSIYREEGVCGATPGRRGVSDMTIDLEACSTSALIHEFGHVLGLAHEHQRPDRDESITVHRENAREGGFSDNFSRKQSRYGARQLTPYDYDSCMHYGATAFGRTEGSVFNRETLETISAPQPFARYDDPSERDIDAINFLYNHCRGNTYDAPVCVSSKTATSSAPASRLWTVEFNARYSAGLTATTTYDAPDARVTGLSSRLNTEVAKREHNVGDNGNVVFVFHPLPEHEGQTYTFATTFTAADGKSVTCRAEVTVAAAPPASDVRCDLEYSLTHQACGMCFRDAGDASRNGCLE